MNELALFAGAGGGILGGKLLGWRTVCAVENEPHAAAILARRQNDGILEPFPIWDDVRTFDGKPWKGIVDVVSGGFPCQDISCSGKGAGIEGKRSGLWSEMARIIREVRPKYALVENSPLLLLRGIQRVLGDLAEMGYNAKWGVLGAWHCGAPHKRERIWIVANSSSFGTDWMGKNIKKKSTEKHSKNVGRWAPIPLDLHPFIQPINPKASRRFNRVDNGLSEGMDRIERIGNAQVPSVVKLAWETLSK